MIHFSTFSSNISSKFANPRTIFRDDEFFLEIESILSHGVSNESDQTCSENFPDLCSLNVTEIISYSKILNLNILQESPEC